jgi:hypothetical protein
MTSIILAAADHAARAIPPFWPLASSVAVNPFLGQSEEKLATTAARLRRVGGVAITMPRAWFAERVAGGEIIDADLTAALDAEGGDASPVTLAMLKDELASTPRRASPCRRWPTSPPSFPASIGPR